MNHRTVARRRFLTGAGGLALALPWLEKFERSAQAQASPTLKRVIVVTYQMGIPGGVWMPSATGSNFTLPYVTAPLDPFKNRALFVSAIDNSVLDAGGSSFVFGHPAKSEAALTGTLTTDAFNTVNTNQLSEIRTDAATMGGANGPSVEYIIGRALTARRFASIDLSVDGDAPGRAPPTTLRSRFFFEGPGNAVSLQAQPHLVFNQFFSDVSGPSQTELEMRKLRLKNKSVLDAVRASFTDLKQGLGSADQKRLQDHADRIRTLELDPVVTAACSAPSGIPTSAATYRGMKMDQLSALQVKLLVGAMGCDLAPVGRLEFSNAQNPRFGIAGLDNLLDSVTGTFDWHGVVHGDALPGTTAYLRPGRDNNAATPYDQRLQDGYRFHVQQFANLLSQLDAISEGQGTTALDNSLCILASDLGEGLGHAHMKMGYILAGNLGAARKGFHLKATPSFNGGGGNFYTASASNVSQLLNSILDMAGVKTPQGQPMSMGLGGWLQSKNLPRRIDSLFV
jgi:Protein of unknown function (DUF1552)